MHLRLLPPPLPLSRTTVAINDIQELVRGQGTKVFQQNPIPEHQDLSFSLVYNGGARTLDIVCKVRGCIGVGARHDGPFSPCLAALQRFLLPLPRPHPPPSPPCPL